jgi:putative hemolysin
MQVALQPAPDYSGRMPAMHSIDRMRCASLIAASMLLSCVVVAQSPPSAPDRTRLANPASEHCVKAGGALTIETNDTGGQFGVCVFEDNRQCEEWALMRGECPRGGLKVTGYSTHAARYCAITGGRYDVTFEDQQGREQGTCTFRDGTHCAASAHFEGTCVKVRGSGSRGHGPVDK